MFTLIRIWMNWKINLMFYKKNRADLLKRKLILY
jgi:hypothetical protein